MASNNTLACPVCGKWTDVIESRRVNESVRRRRYECANGHRFVTILEETLVSILDDRGKYIKVPKSERPNFGDA